MCDADLFGPIEDVTDLNDEDFLKLINHYFVYIDALGVFIYRKSRGSRAAGEVAGHIRTNPSGYQLIILTFGLKKFRAHRIVFLLKTGRMPYSDMDIDHINGCSIDNRWLIKTPDGELVPQLREVTRKENSRNISVRASSITQLTGVYVTSCGKRFGARIGVDSQNIQLGTFDKLEDAAKARKDAEKIYGFHPNHGSPKPVELTRKIINLCQTGSNMLQLCLFDEAHAL